MEVTRFINLATRRFNHEEFSGATALGGVLKIVNGVGADPAIIIHERGAGAGATDGAVKRIDITMTILNPSLGLPG